MKARVYLAGPMNGCTDAEVREWRDWFKQCDMFEWVDPSLRDMRGKELELGPETCDADLEEIDSCEAVVANCWKKSDGTISEMQWAWIGERSVIAICQDPNRPWVRKWSDEVCSNKEAALQKLKEALA